MQEAIKQLLSLQERDLELDKLQSDIAAIPREIAAIQKQMADEKTALEDSKKDLSHALTQRKEKEGQLAAQEDLIRKHAGELNSIKSNDAYRAMMGEIEKGKKDRSLLEDEILQWMDKVDQAQKVWKDREAAAKSVEGQRQSHIAELEAKQKSLEEQKAEKQKGRDDLGATYPPALFSSYQRLRQGKKGSVIVQIKSGQCAGCHMQVSQNVMNEVKRGQKIYSCEDCSRILYLEDAVKVAN